jgi:hypothetical protein
VGREVYTIAGKKLVELKALNLKSGIQIPIDALDRDTYLIEVSSPKAQIARTFHITR